MPKIFTLVVAVLALLAPSPALAGSVNGKGKKPPKTVVSSSPVDVRAVHDTVCPQVTEYLNCGSVKVTVAAYGLTGWTARSGPAAGTVEYNTSYAMTSSGWAQTVSHEMGGHHDAWAELVTKVGTSQAWADWGDLNVFGERWAEGRFAAFGVPRDLTSSEGKEIYLDCVGPVAHGYPGNYLSNRGIHWSSQPGFCVGADTVMAAALTQTP